MNTLTVLKEIQLNGRRKWDFKYLHGLWNREVYSNGLNPTLQQYKVLLSHISSQKDRHWFEWGNQVFNSCTIRYKADQDTFKSYIDLLLRSKGKRKGDSIRQVLKDHDVQITVQILSRVIEGYLIDKNYHKAIQLFEDYYYKSGFLTKEFYEELIWKLARSTKGSNYALKELYYKILKAPDIELTPKMGLGFLRCCKTIKSTEMLYLFTRDHDLPEFSTEPKKHLDLVLNQTQDIIKS